MNSAVLVVVIMSGGLVLVGTILLVVLSAVRRATAQQLVELGQEGIVLNFGRAHMTSRFFRGHNFGIGSMEREALA